MVCQEQRDRFDRWARLARGHVTRFVLWRYLSNDAADVEQLKLALAFYLCAVNILKVAS